MIIIPDISHYEKVTIEPALLDSPALINKVSQGNTFSDSTWLNRSRDIIQNNKLIGGYHFATSDDPASQLTLFLSDVRNALGTIVNSQLKLAVDWEDNPSSQCSQKQCEMLVNGVEVATGKLPLLYTPLSMFQTISAGSVLLRCDLWLAEYGPVAKTAYKLWQYTDNYKFFGINIPCDANKWDGSLEDLTTWWNT